MSNYSNWEDYVYENGVLKNKFGITSPEELHNLEEKITIEKLSILYLNPFIGDFDCNHLKAIHRYLFSDIYEFAGEYRNVDLYKKYTKFEDYKLISSKVDSLLLYARNKEVNIDNKFEIAKFLGDFYYQLILIHPFREGNGRTIREFLREFVLCKFLGYKLEYSLIDQNNFLLGITEHDTYPLLLAYEINNALIKTNIKSK